MSAGNLYARWTTSPCVARGWFAVALVGVSTHACQRPSSPEESAVTSVDVPAPDPSTPLIQTVLLSAYRDRDTLRLADVIEARGFLKPASAPTDTKRDGDFRVTFRDARGDSLATQWVDDPFGRPLETFTLEGQPVAAPAPDSAIVTVRSAGAASSVEIYRMLAGELVFCQEIRLD